MRALYGIFVILLAHHVKCRVVKGRDQGSLTQSGERDLAVTLEAHGDAPPIAHPKDRPTVLCDGSLNGVPGTGLIGDRKPEDPRSVSPHPQLGNELGGGRATVEAVSCQRGREGRREGGRGRRLLGPGCGESPRPPGRPNPGGRLSDSGVPPRLGGDSGVRSGPGAYGSVGAHRGGLWI